MPSFPPKTHLFFKLAGPAKVIPHQQSQVVEVLESHGGRDLRLARTDEEGEELWDIRKNLVYALVASFPNAEIIGTDVCVPLSKLAVLMEQYKRDEEKINEALHPGQKLRSLVVGHVGDGNFHSMMYTLH